MTSTEVTRTPAQQRAEAVFWSRVSWTICAVLACIAIFELARHVYEWLRFGESQKVVFLDWFAKPAFNWIGIQKIIDFFWALPVWMIAVGTMILAGWYADLNDEEAKRLGSQI